MNVGADVVVNGEFVNDVEESEAGSAETSAGGTLSPSPRVRANFRVNEQREIMVSSGIGRTS